MAGIQSHYEINVSKDGRHFFATAEHSCTNKPDFEKVVEVIKAKFPESEGYEVTASYYECYGYGVDMKKPYKDARPKE